MDPKTPEDGDHRTRTGSLGAGAEATAALHADQPGTPVPAADGASGGAPEAVTGRGQDGSADRAGSEPLTRDHEHKPSYGGEGGVPRTSSDQREPINPS